MLIFFRKYDDFVKCLGCYRWSKRGNERKLDNYCYCCLFLDYGRYVLVWN